MISKSGSFRCIYSSAIIIESVNPSGAVACVISNQTSKQITSPLSTLDTRLPVKAGLWALSVFAVASTTVEALFPSKMSPTLVCDLVARHSTLHERGHYYLLENFSGAGFTCAKVISPCLGSNRRDTSECITYKSCKITSL